MRAAPVDTVVEYCHQHRPPHDVDKEQRTNRKTDAIPTLEIMKPGAIPTEQDYDQNNYDVDNSRDPGCERYSQKRPNVE